MIRIRSKPPMSDCRRWRASNKTRSTAASKQPKCLEASANRYPCEKQTAEPHCRSSYLIQRFHSKAFSARRQASSQSIPPKSRVSKEYNADFALAGPDHAALTHGSARIKAQLKDSRKPGRGSNAEARSLVCHVKHRAVHDRQALGDDDAGISPNARTFQSPFVFHQGLGVLGQE